MRVVTGDSRLVLADAVVLRSDHLHLHERTRDASTRLRQMSRADDLTTHSQGELSPTYHYTGYLLEIIC